MHFPNLRHFSLRYNDLGRYGAFELPASSFPSLVYFDLQANKLSEEWVLRLADRMIAVNALKHIDISRNYELPKHLTGSLVERWPRPINIKSDYN
jgi:hypothetical protein